MESLRKVLNGEEDEEASLFGNNVSFSMCLLKKTTKYKLCMYFDLPPKIISNACILISHQNVSSV